ncbi:acyltransferase [Mangrovivirga sp. M17]|uniref:Acyltransferase n=1 Tax=Mangrovivirga halotolerans TaxID=2993936 RepID=A0ABT3RUP1_9BACT|nr:acyltransferase [Mangrovivirga halotolerans]MCX2745338.1 acyltransferase [Mangrovivirga halotolerans]
MNMTLTDYIKKRNGVSIGSPKSLRNNLYRSLGSKNFSTFWNYWNPIFGYYLGKFIFKPLKRFLPVALSLLLTFIFCGLIHDAVTTIYRGELSFFFSIWFLIMGLAVLITRILRHNFSRQSWVVRASVNLSIITACLIATIFINRSLMLLF